MTRVTTAGRLLRALNADGDATLEECARRLGISARSLEECRDGHAPLGLEVQLLLAAVALEMAPAHARLARQLFAQAQSALRVQSGSVESHLTYDRVEWR